jgi:hypothetical protein
MGKDTMSTAILPIDETLTEREIYSVPGTTTSDVLTQGSIISAVSSMWEAARRPVQIRLSSAPRNPAVIETIERLYSLCDLRQGWNSYTARPIHTDVVRYVARWIPTLLQASTPRPAVVPRVQGGLQLEWHRRGVDLEIYIDSPNEIHFEAEEVGGANPVSAPLAGNEESLAAWIGRVSD